MLCFPRQKGPNLSDIGHFCYFIADKELPAEMGIKGCTRKGSISKTSGIGQHAKKRI